MACVEGYVEKIVFRNEENGYSVLSVVEGKKEYCLVGTFLNISEGEYLKAEGDLTEHPMYGEQIRVKSYEFVAPKDAASIKRYPQLLSFAVFNNAFTSFGKQLPP